SWCKSSRARARRFSRACCGVYNSLLRDRIASVVGRLPRADETAEQVSYAHADRRPRNQYRHPSHPAHGAVAQKGKRTGLVPSGILALPYDNIMVLPGGRVKRGTEAEKGANCRRALKGKDFGENCTLPKEK